MKGHCRFRPVPESAEVGCPNRDPPRGGRSCIPNEWSPANSWSRPITALLSPSTGSNCGNVVLSFEGVVLTTPLAVATGPPPLQSGSKEMP